MPFPIIKHLALPGAFLLLALPSSAQSSPVEPWQVFSGTTGRSNSFTIGFGLHLDSQYVYTGFNQNEAPYHSYLFRTDRHTGQRDSLLLTSTDSAAFLPLHIMVEDSLITCFGMSRDYRPPYDLNDQRSIVFRVNKDWHFQDSLIFGAPRFNPWQFLSLGNSYYITENSPAAPGAKLTKLNKQPLKKDTTALLPINTFGPYGDARLSIAFLESIQKLFVTTSSVQGFLLDTAKLRVDSNFLAWDTSKAPYLPNIRDLIHWNDSVYGLGESKFLHLFKYSTQPFKASIFNAPANDSIKLSGERSFRRSYGTTDSLLTLSYSGPFMSSLGNSPTQVRIFAFNRRGQKVWQTKIENGAINLVHSHAMDEKAIFVYVRNYSVADPFAVPQKMLIYKLDLNGNVLQLTDKKIIKVGLQVYPNPSSGRVQYDASAYQGSVQDLQFTLYDKQGRRQFSSPLHQEQGSFDLDHLPSGNYTYQFQNGLKPLRSGILLLQP